MGKVLHFIQWKYRQWDLWQKIWLVGAFFSGCYLSAVKDSTTEAVSMYISVGLFVLVFLKWFVWDTIKYQWDQYQEEQERIVKILKDSEQ